MKFLAVLLLLSGCGSDGANTTPGCHPLAVGDCLLPWPSAYYLKADSSTATGYRVSLPASAMVLDQTGKPMDPTYLNKMDGFSPAGMMVANLKARLDPKQLPAESDLTQSLDASSTVQLISVKTGERVPLFAEVDNNAFVDEDQVLLIHPMIRLQPKSRYVVALQKLVDVNGKKVSNAPFDALKNGAATSSALKSLDYKDLFATLESAGLKKGDLTLAWDFVTASDELMLSHLPPMRDQALTAWAAIPAASRYTIQTVTMPSPADDHLMMELVGTFKVPSFLADNTVATATLNFGSDGKPALNGTQDFKLVVHVPNCAKTATKPLPFMIFGHGLFGDAAGEMNSGYEKQLIDQLCMIQVGTDWIGLSSDDISNIAGTVIPDFSHFDLPTDRLQQAQINFLVMTRLAITNLKDDPNLMLNGVPISDGSEVYYFGCSQGGIEGGTFIGLSPDVSRAALNVPGGAYSLMLTRSADFRSLKLLLNITYPSNRDQEVLLALSQSYWDWSDPITFAPYSIAAPLPGPDGNPLSQRHILMQEGRYDTQVPNVATEMVVRTLGLPLMQTPVHMVYGIDVKAGPLDSAYTQWDVNGVDSENGNTPPMMDNGVHGSVRKLPAVMAQLQAFLTPTGQVTDTCGGMQCVFDMPQ
jgi:hypothetical protein